MILDIQHLDKYIQFITSVPTIKQKRYILRYSLHLYQTLVVCCCILHIPHMIPVYLNSLGISLHKVCRMMCFQYCAVSTLQVSCIVSPLDLNYYVCDFFHHHMEYAINSSEMKIQRMTFKYQVIYPSVTFVTLYLTHKLD